MFNRQLTVGVTKTPRAKNTDAADATPNPYLDPETMLPIVKGLVMDGAKLGGALYAGAKILNTACKIAEIAAKAKF